MRELMGILGNLELRESLIKGQRVWAEPWITKPHSDEKKRGHSSEIWKVVQNNCPFKFASSRYSVTIIFQVHNQQRLWRGIIWKLWPGLKLIARLCNRGRRDSVPLRLPREERNVEINPLSVLHRPIPFWTSLKNLKLSSGQIKYSNKFCPLTNYGIHSAAHTLLLCSQTGKITWCC